MKQTPTILTLTLLSLLFCPKQTSAGSTEHFTIDSAEDFEKGTAKAATIFSDGSLELGWDLARKEVPNEQIIFSSAKLPSNELILGSGSNGTLYKVSENKIFPWVKLPTKVIASIVADEKGQVYAGTLGEGKIYKISPNGKAKTWIQFKEKLHIWSLAYDSKNRILYIGAGFTNAQIWSAQTHGRDEGAFKLIHQTEHAQHFLSLALKNSQTLYAGTSDGARLYRFSLYRDQKTRAEVVFDFDADEINAIDVRESVVAVAANDFEKPPALRAPKGKPNKSPAKLPSAPKSKPGKGTVWVISKQDHVEKIFEHEKGHFTDVKVSPDNSIFASQAAEGKIYRIQSNLKYAVWADVDERQVIGLHLQGESEKSDAHCFVTSDGSAVYCTKSAQPSNGFWMSDVLNAKFRAQWGALSWRGPQEQPNDAVAFQTRSGNTETPDDSWSSWSASITTPGAIQSPSAKFLQIKAILSNQSEHPSATEIDSSNKSPTLFAIQAFYLPQNQRAFITNIREEKPAPGKKPEPASQGEKSFTKKLVWDVQNPDQDSLEFSLRFKKEGQNIWRAMTQENERVEEASFMWNTQSLPDGWYIISVEATDGEQNPNSRSLSFSAVSEPILIDHHAPTFSALVEKKGKLMGKVADSTSPIHSLKFAVDGKPWQPLFPVDRIFDQKTESFSIDISKLAKGSHLIAIQAEDAQGNTSSAETEITKR